YDPVVRAERTKHQEVVLTEGSTGIGKPDDTRMFLNGDLQFSTTDEYRYHEALVHPAMDGPRGNVLVLGGGDGLALRELLRYPDVQHITLVDLDPAVLQLAREDPRITAVNQNSLNDPRATVIADDAFSWMREHQHEDFDTVLIDMPDPDSEATAKLYSEEFYGLVRQSLAPGARVAVQAGSPYFAPQAYWSTEQTLR